jgi:GT2 family glycosyltransferase
MRPDLSLIIVNWKSSEYLRGCLQSLRACSDGLAIEVIVLDNASYDGSDKVTASILPEAIFVQMESNRGFAGANNMGARLASGDVLLFLNPDTEVKDKSLYEMLSVCQSANDAGAIGCRLLNSDGSLQTSCIQSFPTITNQFLDADCFRRLFPRSKLWGMAALFDSSGRIQPVDAISGACLMIRHSIFNSIGGFSEDYFMYGEDLDLCYRVARSGYKNYFVPSATVIHHGGGSTTCRDEHQFANVQMRESVRLFIEKHHGASQAARFKAFIGVSALARLALLRLSGRRMAPSLYKWQSIRRWAAGGL